MLQSELRDIEDIGGASNINSAPDALSTMSNQFQQRVTDLTTYAAYGLPLIMEQTDNQGTKRKAEEDLKREESSDEEDEGGADPEDPAIGICDVAYWRCGANVHARQGNQSLAVVPAAV